MNVAKAGAVVKRTFVCTWRLTKREQEILALLAKGYLYKEIADHLSITLSTVRAHVHIVYEKLHVQSRHPGGG